MDTVAPEGYVYIFSAADNENFDYSSAHRTLEGAQAHAVEEITGWYKTQCFYDENDSQEVIEEDELVPMPKTYQELLDWWEVFSLSIWNDCNNRFSIRLQEIKE